jgi:diguanylate cyclase (GGDEF)-like protein/PAS domain S-box-containing protein
MFRGDKYSQWPLTFYPTISIGYSNLFIWGKTAFFDMKKIAQLLEFQSFEHAPVGIFITDAEGRRLYVNPRWCEIAGLSMEEALGDGWQNAIHPDDRQRCIAAWRNAVANNHPFVSEYRFLHKDGTNLTVLANANQLKDDEGNIRGFIGSITDISTSIETEQQLRFRDAAIATSMDAFAMSDMEGNINYVNQAFVDMWQLTSPEQVIGRKATEFWNNAEDAGQVIEELISSGNWRGNLLARRDDGSTFTTQLSAHMVTDDNGHPLCMMASFLDVSEQIATQQSLDKERSFINAVFENAGVLMVVLDNTGNIVRFNRSCETLTGYSADEVRGRKVWDFLLPTNEVEPVKQVFNELALAAIPNRYDNIWLSSKGEKRLIDWSNDVIRDSTGQVEYIIASGVDITEKRETERALQQHKESLAKAQEIAGLGSWDWNIVTGELHWSDEIFRIFGITPQAFPATYEAFLSYIHPDDRQKVIDAVNSSIANRTSYDIAHRVLRHNGEIRFVKEQGIVYDNNTGTPQQMIGTVHDITDQKRTEARMLKLSQALEQTADMVVITSNKGNIEYVNPAFCENTGYTKEEVIGRNPNILKSGKHDNTVYEKLWQTILAGKTYSNVLVNRRKDGSTYYEEKTITPLKNEKGEVTNYISTGKDITEMMQTQQRLYHLAHHDALTSLPNRTLFMDRLAHSLTRSSREKHSLAVLFLDLDQFKKINDTLGHNIGDKLLNLMSQRLRDTIRSEDTVARLGGDEFAILLEDTSGHYAIRQVADKIINAMIEPFRIGKHELFCTTSIGISIYPEDGRNAENLLKSADTAMYKAKDNGRNNYRFYSAEMNARAFERLNLETNLRYALERDEFILHYQPIYDADNNIESFEALLRWQHPQLGVISPDDFIPLLEETGMIIDVGEWVLHRACQQAHQWHESNINKARISVNLSSRQFGEAGLSGKIWKILQQTKLPAEYLEIEITESTLMQNAQTTIDTLWALNDMGIQLAIDDFGTGYSSLSYLKSFPLDTLKIDRSFVNDLPQDKDDITLVKAIITLAKNLNLKSVAEGIETREQFELLKECGCDLMQGYYLSRPLTEEAVKDISIIRSTLPASSQPSQAPG